MPEQYVEYPMLRSARDRRRDLVDLLPQFLTRRLQGWDGFQPLLADGKLARPDALLLRAIVMETDPGIGRTEAELRTELFNPYATFNPIFIRKPGSTRRFERSVSGYLDI
jgi:hypothetical protein